MLHQIWLLTLLKPFQSICLRATNLDFLSDVFAVSNKYLFVLIYQLMVLSILVLSSGNEKKIYILRLL